VEIGDAETKASGGLESAARCMHANRRRSKRVFWGEDQSSPVLSILVRSPRGTGQDVMPSGRLSALTTSKVNSKTRREKGQAIERFYILKNVAFRWVCHDKGRGVLLNALVLASELYTSKIVREHGLSSSIGVWPLTRLKAAFVAIISAIVIKCARRGCSDMRSSRVERGARERKETVG
jgi:hypothetical protein